MKPDYDNPETLDLGKKDYEFRAVAFPILGSFNDTINYSANAVTYCMPDGSSLRFYAIWNHASESILIGYACFDWSFRIVMDDYTNYEGDFVDFLHQYAVELYELCKPFADANIAAGRHCDEGEDISRIYQEFEDKYEAIFKTKQEAKPCLK